MDSEELFSGTSKIPKDMAKKQVILISHFNYSVAGPIHGPFHSVASYLQRKKLPYRAVAYPLYAGTKSFYEVFNGRKVVAREFGSRIKFPLPIKSFIETLQTITVLARNKPDLVIAIDPLNAFAALTAKKLGTAGKVVFYTADYTPFRFSNKLLNWLYHAIDNFCIKNADSVWNVSTRIMERRREQGVPTGKNIYVPNTPSFKVGKRLTLSKVDRFNIMLVTGVTHTSAFDMVINAVSKLVKTYPRIKLTIIGTGSYEEELKRKIAGSFLRHHVEFLGQLDHETLLKTLPKGGLGLAIYTTDYSWINYGDSMKAREYLLSGLPTVITDVVSTADDIQKYNAGIVVKPDKKEIAIAIDKLIKDRDFWKECRDNAIRLARDFDMDKILDSAFARFP